MCLISIDKITGLEIRLEEIEGIAETNVQSDWAETDITADSYIKQTNTDIPNMLVLQKANWNCGN